jgi:hypothetical protein
MNVGEAEIRFPHYFFGERFSPHDTRSIRVLTAAQPSMMQALLARVV